MNLSFIVIDESDLDCFIAQKIIQFVYPSSTVNLYQNALPALKIIGNTKIETDVNTIILLDLQMPVMNGFEFVEAFEQLPVHVTDQFSIFILSSTRNKRDIARLLSFKSVSGVIEKPLTKEKIKELVNNYLFGLNYS
jgi:CheY-like chemotaxis protein